MAGPATGADLQARSFRTLTTQELEVGEILLEDAYTIITARIPSVVDRIGETPGTSFWSLIVQIQCAMVLRVLRNPEGKLEEAIDDYRWRLDQAVSTGALYLSDAEGALIGSGDGSSDGAWTIRPGMSERSTGWWTRPDVWTTDA